MSPTRQRWWLALLGHAGLTGWLAAQSPTVPAPLETPAPPPPVNLPRATAPDPAQLYPINLPTALQLANARPLDIALATERTQAAAAQLDRARVLWLPT